MSEPWYADGLRFECTRCGNCCTGEPGYVWIDESEMAAIAEWHQLPLDEATAFYAREAYRGRSLREKPNGDCIFFERGRGCTIYEIRPRQCRTWPFWESTTRSPEAWERTTQICPGSGRGELIPVDEITRRLGVIHL